MWSCGLKLQLEVTVDRKRKAYVKIEYAAQINRMFLYCIQHVVWVQAVKYPVRPPTRNNQRLGRDMLPTFPQ